MRPADSLRSWLRRPRAWEAGTAVAAVALYLRTVGFGWVYDDLMEVVLNTFIRSFSHLGEIFTTTVWSGSGMETFLYRPLALVTYALNYQVSGAEPWSYHLVNVLLHAGASVLVVRLGLLWRLPVVAAGLGGLLFAAHPIHVEAVAAVFGRKDLLAALFVLAFALTHRGALVRGGWRRAAAPVLLLAAMLSKEVGVVGLALVVAQDLWLETDRRAFLARREVPLLYASYLAVATLFLLARTSVTGGLGIPDTSFWDNPLVSATVGVRVATALVVVGKGLALLVAPLGQSPDYSFDAIPVVSSPLDPRFLTTALVLAGIAALLATRRLRATALPLATAWYALALLPASNLLVVTGTIFAERLLYLPSVAFCLLAGAGLAWAAERRRRWGTSLAVLAFVGLGAGTLSYARFWTDDVTLFRRAAAAVPTSTKAHHKLGEELLRRGELGDALRSLDRALEIAPENAFASVTREQARAAVVQRFGPTPVAPSQPLPEGVRDDAEILCVLGLFRAQQGETAEALRLLEAAVEARPTLAEAWFNLGALRLEAGDGDAGRAALARFVALAGSRFPTEVVWARSVLARP
ncbi:MAG: DUF1736 domain-containing protein [Longimicrobiales bacterium]|nr:DUF1736 domain-containing protein [Longimicrobiales bacterium]